MRGDLCFPRADTPFNPRPPPLTEGLRPLACWPHSHGLFSIPCSLPPWDSFPRAPQPGKLPSREPTRDSHSPVQSLRWVPPVYPAKAKQSRSVRRSPHNLFSPLLQCSVLFPGLSPEHFPSGRIGALPFLEQGLYFATFTFVHTVASSRNALLHFQHGDLVHTASPVLRELLEAISESRDI